MLHPRTVWMEGALAAEVVMVCTSYCGAASVCTRCTSLGPVCSAVVTSCTSGTAAAGSHSTR